MDRRAAIDDFYDLLSQLSQRLGGPRMLVDCDARSGWPRRGVYFFFEPGEHRAEGSALRVVRVGTHALRSSSSTLWGRLSQHKGTVAGRRPGGGNHRGSIFRLHIGEALIAIGDYPAEVTARWGRGTSAPAEVVAAEYPLELAVSRYIGAMPVLWLDVDDEPGAGSDRGVIEAGAIALLSNYGGPPVDPPSPGWLGRHSSRASIRESGLWNVNHVTAQASGEFLPILSARIAAAG